MGALSGGVHRHSYVSSHNVGLDVGANHTGRCGGQARGWRSAHSRGLTRDPV